MKNKVRGKKENTTRDRKLKGREPLSNAKFETITDEKKVNKDTINRADISYKNMTKNNGLPRHKVGWK